MNINDKKSLNILYIAGSAPIHDYKWINALTANENINGFLLKNRETEKTFFDYGKLRKTTITKKKICSFSITRFWKTIYSVLLINQVIKKHKIDIVHIMYAEPHALWIPFINSKRVKILITTHGTDILQTIPGFSKRKDPLGKLVFKIYKKAFRKAGKITCTSEKQAENVRKHLNKACKPEIIRSGIIIPLEYKKERSIKEPYFLFPRTMRELSNHELAVESIKLLSKDIIKEHKMVFIDSDSRNSAYVEKIKAMSKEIPDADFIFLPSLDPDEFLSLIKHASVVIITNISDGSPVTAMESMYLKKPLILPPLDYDKQLFDENVNFFDEWKSASVAGKIEEVLKEPKNKQDKRLETSYGKVLEFGNFEKEMNKMYNIYAHCFIK